MMSSRRVTNPMRSPRSASPTKNRAIARPSPILAMCCFGAALSSLQEKFHLDASQFDDIVVFEGMGRGADLRAIDGRALLPFDVRDEVALRAPREDGDL